MNQPPPQGSPQPQQQPPMPGQPPGVGVPPPMPGQPPMGAQPPMPGQPPAPGQPYGQGQPPHMQQGWPGQPMQAGYPGYPGHPGAGMGQQANSGSPVGAFFLGLLASFVIAAIYTASFALTYEEQSLTVVNTLYCLHGVINGGVVGWLAGTVGRRSTGAHVGGAIVATLGTFFGFTNAMPLILVDAGGDVLHMVKQTPLYPVEAWWGATGAGHFFALLGLVLAAGAAWGVAYAVGRKRP